MSHNMSKSFTSDTLYLACGLWGLVRINFENDRNKTLSIKCCFNGQAGCKFETELLGKH